MSPTPTEEYSSTTIKTHTYDGKMLGAADGQPAVTINISKGKKGLEGSVIAGAIIGGLVVLVLILAVFFGLRHRRRRAKRQTASITEAGQEGEKKKETCDEANEPPPPCPYSNHGVTYPAATFQGVQNSIIPCQTELVPSSSSLRQSFDSSRTYPIQTNYSNITTHAPRPQPHRTGPSIAHNLDPSSNGPPCMSCALHHPGASHSGAMSLVSAQDEDEIYNRKQYVSSASPPLPPGAMPPLSSPTIETYDNQANSLSPPESPKSPGGSSLSRWIISPLSRSGTARTALPPYEQQGHGLQHRVSEKKEKEKDESALAASVYTFM